jgi:hypothetical protein
MSFNLPAKIREQLVADFGKNTNAWPEELRDLINPSVEARSIAPPESGKVEKFLNTDYHYHWAKDICGQNPWHERVEGLRWAGWSYATTDDVQMCSEDAVQGRSKDRKSKDGKGFSDEIRSGDRRLMKCPMSIWRASRKAQNIAAFQLAYPQPFAEVAYDREGVGDRSVAPSFTGKPMSSNLIPGVNTEMMNEEQISDARSKAKPGNSVTVQRGE